MKNSLTVLALVFASAAPAAFIIELAGTHLPAIVDSAHLFGAFMLTLLLKLMIADYARSAQPPPTHTATGVALPSNIAVKSPLRLAA